MTAKSTSLIFLSALIAMFAIAWRAGGIFSALPLMIPLTVMRSDNISVAERLLQSGVKTHVRREVQPLRRAVEEDGKTVEAIALVLPREIELR